MSPATAPERLTRTRRASAGTHRAAGRVVDILELVVASANGLALRELATRLEAPKSSLLPLLRTLSARRYLAQGPRGEYGLGRRALELGLGSPAHRGLPGLARPALRALMQRTGETVFLGTLSSDGLAVVSSTRSTATRSSATRVASGTGGRCMPPRAAR